MVVIKIDDDQELDLLAEDLANGVEILFELPAKEWGWDKVHEIILLKLKEYRIERNVK
jgi:hypothetical protein